MQVDTGVVFRASAKSLGAASIRRRWSRMPQIHGLTPKRATALLVNVLPAATLVPAYVLLAPATHWSNPVLLVALLAISMVGYNVNFRATAGSDLDPCTAVGLIALVIYGPLVALAIMLAPFMLTRALGLLVGPALKLRNKPLMAVAFVSDIGSY